MSILTVENVSHGFGARKILENASFRLLKGEHVGKRPANPLLRARLLQNKSY